MCILKSIDQNNICASTVFKADTVKKIQKKFVDPQKARLWVLKQKPLKTLKTVDTQMLFWSKNFQCTKKKLVMAKMAKMAFLLDNSFF